MMEHIDACRKFMHCFSHFLQAKNHGGVTKNDKYGQQGLTKYYIEYYKGSPLER